MSKLRALIFPLPLLFAIALSACGNKGDLVRPMPSTLPPAAATPDDNAKPAPDSTSPRPDPASKPAPDADGH